MHLPGGVSCCRLWAGSPLDKGALSGPRGAAGNGCPSWEGRADRGPRARLPRVRGLLHQVKRLGFPLAAYSVLLLHSSSGFVVTERTSFSLVSGSVEILRWFKSALFPWYR